MLNEYRIKTHISPKVESKLLNWDIDQNLIDYFFKTIGIFKSLRHLCFFCIPMELLTIFESHKILKLFKEQVTHNSQSNVMFYKESLSCESTINLIDIFPAYPESNYAKKYALRNLESKSEPSLIDSEKEILKKNICNVCGESKPCNNERTISTIPLADLDRFKKDLHSVVERAIETWHFDTSKVTNKDIKGLALLSGFFYGFPFDKLNMAENLLVHRDLIDDLKKMNALSLTELAFAMLRAISLPSSSNINRVDFSIDWHRNNPYKIRGYDYNLFRVDVVTPNRTGIHSSGKKRLLFAQKEDYKIFINYTDEHDFTKESIELRLKSLQEPC